MSGGDDKTVRLWRLEDGAPLMTIPAHSRIVWSVRFSPDGKTVASGSFDHSVKLWDAGSGKLLRTLSGHSEAVVSIAFSPDGNWLASGGDDKVVRLWRLRDGKEIHVLRDGAECVYAVAFSPDSRWVAGGGRERSALTAAWENLFGRSKNAGNGDTIRLWKVPDGGLAQILSGHSGDVHGLAFSSDGRWLASSGDDRTVRLWSLTPREPASR